MLPGDLYPHSREIALYESRPSATSVRARFMRKSKFDCSTQVEGLSRERIDPGPEALGFGFMLSGQSLSSSSTEI